MYSIFIQISLFILTLGTYIVGKALYRRSKNILFHTVIISTILLILILSVSGIGVEFYQENSGLMRYLLDLSVVSLGFLLFRYRKMIREKFLHLITATFVGSLVSLLFIGGVLILFRADLDVIVSMLPKSITAPMAIPLVEQYGGLIPLTASVVIIGGLFGAIVGPWFLELCGINSPFAVGLALGASSHGIGTARALEFGEEQGAAGALGICLMGIFTSLMYPLIVRLIIFYYI